MAKTCTIAEARRDLPRIIHGVERGRPVEITRRGKPVAVVMSMAEYRRIAGGRPSFREAYEAWRRQVDVADLGFSREFIARLRDRSPGRPVEL